MSLRCWLQVTDDCFPASNFASSWNLDMQSDEPAALHVNVRKYLHRKLGWTRVTDGVHTRTHLEAQLASALALKSPNEYQKQMNLVYKRVVKVFLVLLSGSMYLHLQMPIIWPATQMSLKVQGIRKEFMDPPLDYEVAEANPEQIAVPLQQRLSQPLIRWTVIHHQRMRRKSNQETPVNTTGAPFRD